MVSSKLFVLLNALVAVLGSEKDKRSPQDNNLSDKMSVKETGGQFLYTSTTGPYIWPLLHPQYCSKSSQSPVNINRKTTVKTNYQPFSLHQFDETPEDVHLHNSGNSVKIQFNFPSPIRPLVTGGGLPGVYHVTEAHYHWGSSSDVGAEHTIDDHRFPLELHVVTINSKYKDLVEAIGKPGGIAVLGFSYKIALNPKQGIGLRTFIGQLEKIRHPAEFVNLKGYESFVLKDLFADLDNILNSGFYRYNGSLTTPPCTENVIWTVFKELQEVSEVDMQNFRNTKSYENVPMINNYRPVQPLNGRTIYESPPNNLKEQIIKSVFGKFYDFLALFPKSLSQMYNNNAI